MRSMLRFIAVGLCILALPASNVSIVTSIRTAFVNNIQFESYVSTTDVAAQQVIVKYIFDPDLIVDQAKFDDDEQACIIMPGSVTCIHNISAATPSYVYVHGHTVTACRNRVYTIDYRATLESASDGGEIDMLVQQNRQCMYLPIASNQYEVIVPTPSSAPYPEP